MQLALKNSPEYQRLKKFDRNFHRVLIAAMVIAIIAINHATHNWLIYCLIVTFSSIVVFLEKWWATSRIKKISAAP
jgi:hypothetical protein